MTSIPHNSIVPYHDGMLEYNALDSAVTLEIWNEISKEFDEDYLEIYHQTEALLDPLMYMMTRGIAVDVPALRAESTHVEKQIEEKQAKLDELAGFPLNANSSKQCQQYFYIDRGITPYTKSVKDRTTGKIEHRVTMDDKALARIARGTAARKPMYEARLIQEIRGLAKLKGTYLDIEFDEDNRMRCSFNPRGTRFSRLSSSKTIRGTGMNMQNLPASFQRFLVADPGYLALQLDKQRAEWVVVAYESGDSNMIHVIEEDKDPHAYTASQMYKVNESLVIREQELIGHSRDPVFIEEQRKKIIGVNTSTWPRMMSLRQVGKHSNHGFNYDEGYRTWGLTYEVPEKEAKFAYNFYHNGYPGIKRWYDFIRGRLVEDNRTLRNSFGRKYHFLAPMNDQLYKQAYSYLPQSTVGDLVNRAINEIYYDRVPDVEDVELLSQVHDSIWIQHPVGDWPKMARAAKSCAKALTPEIRTAYSDRPYVIGTDCIVGTNFFEGDQVEIDLSLPVDALADQLKQAYEICQERER